MSRRLTDIRLLAVALMSAVLTPAAGNAQTIPFAYWGATVTITLSPSTLASGWTGDAYSQTVSASGGTSPYSYSVTSGSAPSGLSLNSSTGAITGTPTTVGTSSFTITATDKYSYTGSQAYSITIAAPPVITLSPSTLPTGTKSTAYSQTISASGGVSPYTYSVTSGSLPSGISLSSGGVLSGTPTVHGSFSITITATDANSNPGSQAYSLIIYASPTVVTTTSTTCNGLYCYDDKTSSTYITDTINAICGQAGYVQSNGTYSTALTGGRSTYYYSGTYPSGSWVGGSGGGCTSSCYYFTNVTCI